MDAADSILSMRKSAEELLTDFDEMREACDANSLKRKLAAAREQKQNAADGNVKRVAEPSRNSNLHDYLTHAGLHAVERKRRLYSAASQIKLLVDTPEQVGSAVALGRQ
jgi:hypothetical protein